jgi:5-(carboxyamino)imidazole ribonucleotide synthase
MQETSFFSTTKKIGILGGGQLGKMLLQCTRTWDVYTKVLDPDNEAPCKLACNEFIQGDLNDFETVYNFGVDCDVITIEIEHVNIEALEKLELEGKIVIPSPNSLKIIKDKGLQKEFYVKHNFPTSAFALYNTVDEIKIAVENKLITLPFVQKSRTGGYDGKGVHVVNSFNDLDDLLQTPSVVEQKVNIKKEIAVIVSRNQQGEIACYDAVSMSVHETANLLDELIYPAEIETHLNKKAKDIAVDLIAKMDVVGLLAVEFFINENDEILINEVAPRPHNSGHQTIESSYTSQYQQHLRCLLGLPLGSTQCVIPSVMINVLGEPGYTGNVQYVGLDNVLKIEGVYVHLYGKKTTKPFRKMGHVTIINNDINEAKKIATWVKTQLKVIAK